MSAEENKRYNSFSKHLKDLFGCKVYKVTLDAGFNCPNRDGTLSKSGCIFCDEGGSFSRAQESTWPVEKQLSVGINNLRTRFKAKKFLAYFQAYSNTYKDTAELKSIYDRVTGIEDVLGFSIATRPDCINDEKIELIESYTKNNYVWIEYGVQSIHDKSLNLINRGHNAESIFKAIDLTKRKGSNINVCAHVIIGLPGETLQDVIDTAKTLSSLKVNGVKIHLLCVLQNTTLEKIYLNGDFEPVDQQTYVEYVCSFLEHLSKEITIHRMAGNGLKKILVAPKWLPKKFELLNQIDYELAKRETFQGKLAIQTD